MGNKVPVPDERMQKTIDLLKLEKRHIRILWKRFQAHDQDKSGTIDIGEFYKMINEERTVFGDSIFELIDIDNNGTLDFSEFVQTLGTYCMFGRNDILKFCFFVFDKDKNGYIEQDELHALIEMLHGNDPQSNNKIALEKFDTNKDGKIDFGEFSNMNIQFPRLLFPAYRMQDNMMEHTLGMKWWKKRKEMLEGERSTVRRASEKLRLKELRRQKKIQQREVMHKMGMFNYYACFWKRAKYMAAVQTEVKPAQKKKNDKLSDEEIEANKKRLQEMFKDKENGENAKKKEKKAKDPGARERKAGDKASTPNERAARAAKRKADKAKSQVSGSSLQAVALR